MYEADQLVALVRSQLPDVEAVVEGGYKQWRVYLNREFRDVTVSGKLQDVVVVYVVKGVAYTTLAKAAVEAVKSLGDGQGDEVLEGLFAAKLFIENTSIARSSSDDHSKLRCFHCDEFMMEAEWPNHGNPNCEAKKAYDAVEAALKKTAEE